MVNHGNLKVMQVIERDIIKSVERAKIDYILNLPCERIKLLISLLSESFDFLTLAREEEGIGISAGLFMAGRRPLMVIQSSGFGNCINALMSLTACYKLPLPILISWRGVYGEKIEAQKPLGKKLPRLLEAMGIDYLIFNGENFSDVENAIAESYEENKIKAILLRPDIWTQIPDASFSRPEIPRKKIEVEGGKARFTRYEILKGIREELEGKIIVSNIGYPSRELYNVLDQPTNFYMLGSMGLATGVSLGIALTGKEVIAIEGDGSILMNPSTLFTAVNSGADGLTVLAIDNAAYGSTGNQVTATLKADLHLLAISAGFKAFRTSDVEDIRQALRMTGTKFIHAIAKPGNAKVPLIPLKAEKIKERFMEAIG